MTRRDMRQHGITSPHDNRVTSTEVAHVGWSHGALTGEGVK